VNEFDRNRLARSSVDIAARLKGMAAKTGRLQPEETGSPAKGGKPGRADYLTVKAMLQERLLDEIGERGLLEHDGADVVEQPLDDIGGQGLRRAGAGIGRHRAQRSRARAAG